MMIRGYEIAGKLIAYVVAGVVIIALALLVLNQCSKRRSEAAQGRVQGAQAQAASNSAADAVNTVARSGEAERASEDLTRKNEQEIRNAKGAGEAVDPAVRDAGLRSLCKRDAYRNDPKCRVLKPNPR